MVECEHEHPPILPTTPSLCLEPVNCCAGRGGQALTFNPTDKRNTLNNQHCKRNSPLHCIVCIANRAQERGEQGAENRGNLRYCTAVGTLAHNKQGRSVLTIIFFYIPLKEDIGVTHYCNFLKQSLNVVIF